MPQGFRRHGLAYEALVLDGARNDALVLVGDTRGPERGKSRFLQNLLKRDRGAGHVENDYAPAGERHRQVDAVERFLGDRPHEQVRHPGFPGREQLGIRWGVAAKGQLRPPG